MLNRVFRVLKRALDQMTDKNERRCSTALCAIFTNGLLKVVNLGTSGFMMVFDDGRHSIRSRRQPNLVYQQLDRLELTDSRHGAVQNNPRSRNDSAKAAFLFDPNHADECEVRMG